MAFGDPTAAYERLMTAYGRREPLSLTVDEVDNLVDQLPDEDEYISYDEVSARLSKIDVKALRISLAAREEIATAFGWSREDIWL